MRQPGSLQSIDGADRRRSWGDGPGGRRVIVTFAGMAVGVRDGIAGNLGMGRGGREGASI